MAEKKIAFCGFGRIGRSATRAALRDGRFVPAAITDVQDLPTLAALFAVDTDYGRWPEPVSAQGSTLVIGDRQIPYLDARQGPANWGALGVSVVVDCTGRATTRAAAQAHLDRGAERVLISAFSRPPENCDVVLLPGINLGDYRPAEHRIINMASCTTNALAPVVKVLRDCCGLEGGFFSTVHAYTSTQVLIDAPMRDRRDSWAAAANIVPSSSGAASALQYIWPELVINGQSVIKGKAYRVPVSTGSIVELNALVNRPTTPDEVRDAFRQAAAEPPLTWILGVLEEEYASCRIVGEKLSSIVDLPLVDVAVHGKLVSVAAWYDNQMGYATRLAEMALAIA